MAGEAPTSAERTTRRERWLGWFDGSLFTLAVGSLAVVVGGGLVQVSFGAFEPEAFPAVPEENQLFDRQRVRDIIAGDLRMRVR